MTVPMNSALSGSFLFQQPPRTATRPMILCSNSIKNTTNENPNELSFIRNKILLKSLSTWGIGGPCHYFVQVSNSAQLVSALRFCQDRSIRYTIIGKGSNCLFDDLGFDGCVILNRIEFLQRPEPGVYQAGSGFQFNRLGILSSSEGFTGLEFAGGVPATVGGAVYMNAGANGQETANVVEEVEIVTTEGKFQRLSRKELEFGYRLSAFQSMKDLAAIVAVTFRLQESNLAKKRLQEYLERRRLTQPVRERTAGSVFKNPTEPGFTAAGMIDKAGLKGFRIGEAMVSDVHANFFINLGNSSSKNMLDLIAHVKQNVNQKFGIQLEEEVIYLHPHQADFRPNSVN